MARRRPPLVRSSLVREAFPVVGATHAGVWTTIREAESTGPSGERVSGGGGA
ncbi:MAG TPA: hypothetical protein RMH85_21395 [Polyangiaceae bacterium LLY-WYZ-15_(1-7)]|nr:hypothetical protein [Polyangiaceae bacterium LLY-WYZ-15_(1-7)]HJL11045.1 hypothetical protein [Polyangiaceae bacterium LLY-WYZ-15_(1-7)]HJL37515.1 hypothetical protein [Polyangiaceae bacterium LLY-WYZ-15_(1-7)]HJL45874.1 hypothetical protein [Polyangiaceae bacterium LLY-WYZ-15_(1-7)]